MAEVGAAKPGWGELHCAPHSSAVLHLSHLVVPEQAAGEKADG